MSPEDLLRHFWLELFNRRAIDEMAAYAGEDYDQHDHRAIGWERTSRAGFLAEIPTWWEIAPDVRAELFQPLRRDGDRVLYRVVFRGTDSVSGGALEVELVILDRFRGHQVVESHLFDDERAGLAAF